MDGIRNLKVRLSLLKVKPTSKRLILERQLQVAVRCLIGASRQTLERALATLELPNETKIKQLYESQPAIRHHVVIDDIRVR